MAELDADTLLPNDHVKQLALDGDITQIHRGNPYAEVGDTFAVDGTTFEVTDVTHRTLGDLTDEDARAEGSEDLDAYRKRLEHAHSDGFEWDDDADVVRHRFERVE
ncbi:ASCH domain-containing protein [Halomarina litorea]|uniref:ASCH domain-containing protein n=1 Tax=Halomarina litorea TaxID=2961595 RepID=UPI0020C4E46D|nr:ASCH domain-containing protein [Halomarina sp. BCD28]